MSSFIKPRICEIFNVEVGEEFNIRGLAFNPCKINTYYVLDSNYELVDVKHLTQAINNPELIEKIIRYSDEQKEILKALKTLGYNYLAKDRNERVFAYINEPRCNNGIWGENSSEFIMLKQFDPKIFNFVDFKKAVSIEISTF